MAGRKQMSLNLTKVGPYKPVGAIVSKEYVGLKQDLYHKQALVGKDKDGLTVAQFDDKATGYAYGWHAFDEREFK
jgi:hypothetical protein